MEDLLKNLGAGWDLAAVASSSGLIATGVAALLVLTIGGKLLKFILRAVFSAVLTGVGFYYLMPMFGYQIVSSDEYQDDFQSSLSAYEAELDDYLNQVDSRLDAAGSDSFLPESVRSLPARPEIRGLKADGSVDYVLIRPGARSDTDTAEDTEE